jgi:hypothetical protein
LLPLACSSLSFSLTYSRFRRVCIGVSGTGDPKLRTGSTTDGFLLVLTGFGKKKQGRQVFSAVDDSSPGGGGFDEDCC